MLSPLKPCFLSIEANNQDKRRSMHSPAFTEFGAYSGRLVSMRPAPTLFNRLGIFLILLLFQGCTLTQEQIDQISLEHSHSLNRVAFSGNLRVAESPVALFNYDEVGLETPEINYRPGLALRRGPVTWSLEQIRGQAESISPFSANSGNLSLPQGSYSFGTDVTSTKLCQDLLLELAPEIKSPKIHWLTGIDFVDYRLSVQSQSDSSSSLKLSDVVHVPFTGFMLEWRLNQAWDLKGIFTKSWLSNSGGQPSEYEELGTSLEWAPSSSWRTFVSLTRKSMGFDRRAGGEPLHLQFDIEVIEWGVTFFF